jgi:hypothetical protein
LLEIFTTKKGTLVYDLESVVICKSKQEIDFILSGYPELEVVGSRMVEEGYELLVEGDAAALSEFIWEVQDEDAK